MKSSKDISISRHKLHNKISIKSLQIGLVVTASLISYFLVMKLLNLHEVLILRTGNFILLAAGILYALKYFTKKLNIDYLQGIKIGAYVTAFSVLPFALFMYFYLHLDAEFMSIVQQHSPFGDYLNPGVAAGALVFEGVASGLLFTYIVMPYFKKE